MEYFIKATFVGSQGISGGHGAVGVWIDRDIQDM